MDSYERFCSAYLATVPHPFGGGSRIRFSSSELQQAVACVRLVIVSPVSEARLADLRERFDNAFQDYLQTPRDQQGALINSVERLAQLVEPYLKKLILMFYPNKNVRSGNGVKPLWHYRTDKILTELKLVRGNLKNNHDAYWRSRPAEEAVWRIASVSRHKGTHEAHNITLPDIEKIAISVSTSLLLAARHALNDPQSGAQMHGELQEALRFRELIAVRTKTFPVTHDLPTVIEMLRLYRSRQHISADDSQAQLLFRAYCAGQGPAFAFLQGRTPRQLIRWAYDISSDSDKSSARGAAAFLLAAGSYIPLRRIQELFTDYRHRLRLAEYIPRVANRRDFDILWQIILRHKSPRVRSAATSAFSKLVLKTDNQWLSRISRSTSPNIRPLWLMTTAKLARETNIKRNRRNLYSRSPYIRQIAALGIGITGDKTDIGKLRKVSKSKRDKRTKTCAIMGLAMLAARTKDYTLIHRLLLKEPVWVAKAAAEGIGLLKNPEYTKDLAAAFKRAPSEVAGALELGSSPRLRTSIRRLIQNSKCDAVGRLLVLALCHCAGRGDFVFLLHHLAQYNEIIHWDAYEIMQEVAVMAKKSKAAGVLIRQWLRSSEFWEYFPEGEKPKDYLPVKRHENLVITKGIIGLAFGELAGRSDRTKILHMLRHGYWAVNRGGANALIRLADINDIQRLVNQAISNGGKHEGELNAIVGLDLSTYCVIPEVIEEFKKFGALAAEGQY